MRRLRIASRGSDLALWQANFVRDHLLKAHGDLEVAIEVFTTRGDKILDVSLDKIPGKGLFTKEIEEALLAGKADLAVHSLKDLPTEMAPSLKLAAIMQREDPAEALISRQNLPLGKLPPGAAVMTGSLRRAAQLLYLRGDLKILPVRGNVPTRVRKFQDGQAEAIILACAGLIRLGLAGHVAQRLDPREFLPACGQGALAVQTRADDEVASRLCEALEHLPTRLCVTAERSYLQAMGGGCQAPLGAYGRFESAGVLTLTAMAARVDGRRLLRNTAQAGAANMEQALALGRQVASAIAAEGVEDIMIDVQHQPKLSQENA